MISKIVVTGALGHIGSRLIRELPASFPGAEIVLIDNLSTQRFPSLFNLPAIGRYRFVEADVTNADLAGLFGGAYAVVHLAAMTDASGTIDRADELEANNYNATERVARACLETGARMVHLSSTSVYGSQEELVDENCPREELKPQSPYATVKLKEEDLVRSLSPRLKGVVCRFGTIFGISRGMRFHTAVNKFCWQAVMGSPLTVWRTAYDQKRPYLDLSDACRAISMILQADLFDGATYNVVTVSAAVRDVVEAIQKFVPELQVSFVDNRIMNQLSYEVSADRIAAQGFTPFGSLPRAVGETVSLLRGARTAF